MVVRRTDKGDIGLTSAAWLEDRTTTTYQPSHLRPAATARRHHAPPPPPPPMFGPRTLAPAMAGASSSRASSMYAPVASPRLTLPSAALRELEVHENPFARPRGAVGASFWNALAFAGLFASVLIGRVIVQAGQEGAQAATTTRAAATQPAAAIREPASTGPQNSGAGGVGTNALAPGAERVSQEEPTAAASDGAPTAAAPATQPAAATNGAPGAQPTAATISAPAAQPTAATDGASTSQPTTATPAAAPQPAAAHVKRSDSTPHAHRGHAARPRSEALDWRQETSVKASEPAPLPAAKPAVADPTAGLGTLRINSRPWSQVFIDGRLVGNTPQLGLRLPAGRYSVRLSNAELGMSKTLIVNVAAGEFVSRVETLEEP